MSKFILSVLLVFPFAAFAAEGGTSTAGSNFFYQAPAGKHVVTPSLQYVKASVKVGGVKADVTQTTLQAEYEYGLMPELSVGGNLGYSNNKNESTTTTKDVGLENIDLFVKGTMPAGPGALKYGATLSFSPGNTKEKANGDQSNNYTGGNSITPYVGYEYNMAPCTVGAKLATDINLGDRTKDTNGTKTKESGAETTTLSLFYEHEMNADMRIGASLDWQTQAKTKDKTANTTSENITPVQVISAYLPTKLGSGVLIPTLGYGMTTDKKVNGSDIDTFKVITLSASYRMEF